MMNKIIKLVLIIILLFELATPISFLTIPEEETPQSQETEYKPKDLSNQKDKSQTQKPRKNNKKSYKPDSVDQSHQNYQIYPQPPSISNQQFTIDNQQYTLRLKTTDPKGILVQSQVIIQTSSQKQYKQVGHTFEFKNLEKGKVIISVIPNASYLQTININTEIHQDSDISITLPPSEFKVLLIISDTSGVSYPPLNKLNYKIYLNNTEYSKFKYQNNTIIIPIISQKSQSLEIDKLTQEEISRKIKLVPILPTIEIAFKDNKDYYDYVSRVKLTPELVRNKYPQYKRLIILEKKQISEYLKLIPLFLILTVLSILAFLSMRLIPTLIQKLRQSMVKPSPSNKKLSLRSMLKSSTSNESSVSIPVTIPATLPSQQSQPTSNSSSISNPMVGDYVLLERVGSGATAVVYKAQNIKNKSIVALKLIHKHLFTESWFKERIENEIQINKILSHPNIIKILDYNLENDQPYLVFEFVQGKSLTKILEEKKKLPLDKALNIWIQILEALDYAHQKGIVHRDLKPDNILIQDEKVKITDFGISKKINKTLNITQEFVGTPWYMSPEQIKNQKVDNRSDIYSLGVIVYQMLTGKLPFDASENIYAIFKAHMFDTPISTNLTFEDTYVPPDIEKIIRKMLEKEPKKRYQYCQEIIQDLTPYIITFSKK
ncbi:MAG: serine/threonine-protein kinase [bacterium]